MLILACVGCKKVLPTSVSLKFCEIRYAKLPGSDHRLHVVALYDGAGPIVTDDPLGFYKGWMKVIMLFSLN